MPHDRKNSRTESFTFRELQARRLIAEAAATRKQFRRLPGGPRRIVRRIWSNPSGVAPDRADLPPK